MSRLIEDLFLTGMLSTHAAGSTPIDLHTESTRDWAPLRRCKNKQSDCPAESPAAIGIRSRVWLAMTYAKTRVAALTPWIRNNVQRQIKNPRMVLRQARQKNIEGSTATGSRATAVGSRSVWSSRAQSNPGYESDEDLLFALGSGISS